MNLTKSKIFLFFCLSFIFGTAIASFVTIPYFIAGIFLIVAIISISLFWLKNWRIVVLGFCLIFVVIGIWRFGEKGKISEMDISQLTKKESTIQFIGIIDTQPEKRIENQKIIVKINNSQQAIEGKILIWATKFPEYEYGDVLEITGKIKAPQNFTDEETGLNVDYKNYLAKDDIYSIIYYPEIKILNKNKGNLLKEKLFKINEKLENKVREIFPEPQASLANGLILGEKATLPEKLMDIFAVVGITHIIALSGFNITIIAESLRRFFDKLMVARQYSFWLTTVLIISFVLMTGASASIVRAGVMGILIILARKIGRLYNIRNALVLAAVVMIWANPKILRFDLGFQLSFLATLGLVYLSPFLEKYFLWLPEKFDLRGIGLATISAQLAVLPLLLFSFGKLSLISPLANLLILPVIPLAMLMVFLSALMGFAWLKIGIIIGWFAEIFLNYAIKLAVFLSKIPLATINVKINQIWLFLLYVIILAAVFWINKKIKLNNKNGN